ncbi:hypothetical protein HU200_008044 [Digitaria exilis]|uniref:Uncharacterized protein n=1 Tax=Digitaria exilis TaxID=1010633 RepID=A0A835FN81_9POAL|nr:hypothetical protein HU200_008044 [Digitaria exilis]
MRINDYLPGLTKIEISDLPSCNNLPPLGQLPNLTHLYIGRMDSIKKIGEDLYGGTRTFPRLLELVIDEMKFLEEWNTAVSGDKDGLNMLHQIGSVKIRHCPRLRFKPRPPQCSRLEIECSDEVMLSSLGNRCQVGAAASNDLFMDCCAVPLHLWSMLRQLPCLEWLTFMDYGDLACSSPDFLRGHTSLKSLTVRHCQSIASLPERLGDLTSLELIDCKRMKTLPDTIQKLRCLDSLVISECPELVQWCKSKEMKLAHIKEIVCVLTPIVLCSLNASTTLLQIGMGYILSYVFYARCLISLQRDRRF